MDRFEDDERISAYLDGELTADEQSQFEERLAESAELRQLIEELCALRGSIDLLPRHRLEEDFAERVLRRAEREVLASSQLASDSAADVPAGNVHSVPSLASRAEHTALPRRRSLRPLIYAGAAIAAAILLMVFDRTRPPDKQVAQVHPQNGELPANQSISARSGGDSSDRKRSGSMMADTKKSSQPLDNALDKSSPEGSVVGGGQQSRTPLGKDDRPATDAEAVARLKQVQDAYAVDDRTQKETDTKRLRELNSKTKLDAAEPKAGRLSLSSDAASSPKVADSRSGDRVQTTPEARKEAEGFRAGRFFAGGSGGMAKDQTREPASGGQAASRAALGRRESQIAEQHGPASDENLKENAAAAGGLLLADCVALGENSAEAKFKQLLAERKIAWRETANGQGEVAELDAAVNRGSDGLKGNETLDDQTHRWSMRLDQLAEAERIASWEFKNGTEKNTVGQTFDTVYVEGTSDQVLGLIDDLKALQKRNEVFKTVSLAVVPDTVAARDFGYYQESVAPKAAGSGLTLEYGSAPVNRPASKQTESRSKSPQPNADAIAVDALPIVQKPATETPAAPSDAGGLLGGRASRPANSNAAISNAALPNAAAPKDVNADQGLDRAKSKVPSDAAAAAKPPAVQFRVATPDGDKAPLAAAAAAPPAPAAADSDLKAPVVSGLPAERKPSDEPGTAEYKSLEGLSHDRDLARSRSFALRLGRSPTGPATGAKPADWLKGAADSPSEPAQQAGVTLHARAQEPANGGSGALGGESAAPVALDDLGTIAQSTKKAGLAKRDAQGNGRGISGLGSAAGATGVVEEGKTEFYLYVPNRALAVSDGTATVHTRMRAIIVFRAAPEAAAAAQPVAGPASLPAGGEPAKK